MKRTPLTMTIALCLGFTSPASAQAYKDTDASPRERAESIVKEMTLDEKVSLMRYESAAIPRLGIKQYNWWSEALHGVARAGTATVFPQPIGMAASFDDRLVYDVFTAVSDEARAKNQKSKGEGPLKIYQGLTFWTPNVNIFRDPRWGRGHETYGEDPWLTTRMGLSVVRGLQGDYFEGGRYQGNDAPKYYKLHACAKHFAVHSGPEWSRHSFNAKDISPRDLWETYLPSFRALVVDGDVKEVMCAYNRYEDEPCCGSNKLLNSILRNEWGYKNIVVSDCWAINDFFDEGAHHTEPDEQHAAAKAVRTGTDLECGGTYRSLTEGVEKGLISESEIDKSLVRLMTARYELGEMDNDSLVEWTKIPFSVVENAEHKALAKKMALETMVLLKNDGILPLSKDLKIGLIGPNANDSVMQWGNYNGFPTSTSTLLSALQQRLPANQLVYVPGIDHTANTMTESLFSETASSTGNPGFDAVFYNNPQDKNKTINYNYSQPIRLTTAGATVWAPGVNLGGFEALLSTTFKPDRSEKIAFSIQLQGWMALTVNGEVVFKGGNMKSAKAYEMDVEAGKTYQIGVFFRATEGDCASLYFDFGRQAPINKENIVRQLKDVDVVIFAGGLSPQLEGEEMPVRIEGFKGGDRETIELPQVQQDIMDAITKSGKPIVYVNFSGSAVALTDKAVPAEAVLQAWYPGQAGGDAVCDVLYGDYNPSGKLPITFYKSTADLPDFQDYRMDNRTYRYFKGEALYPFGHGLSYTTFEYGKAKAMRDGKNVNLEIEVKNTGKANGVETMQVYLSRPSDTNGPVMQLRDFKRVDVAAGKTERVTFVLTPEQFNWFDAEHNVVRPMDGKYTIYYGDSSDKSKLKSIDVDYTL